MKNHFIILLLLPALLACNKAGKIPIQNLNNNEILAIGHGGSGYKSFINSLPMNTFESMKCAIEKDFADGVEMDVQLSADHQLVVFHDEMLEQSTDCNGLVIEHTRQKLSECVYSSFFCRLTGKDFPVVGLEEIMRHFSELEKKPLLVFDLKLYPGKSMDNEEYLKRFASAIHELANKYRYSNQILIESTSEEMLVKLKVLHPELKLFIYPADFETGFSKAKELGLYGITIRNTLITKEQVELAHQNGLRVTIWGTRNKKANEKAVSKNPDYIQTDNIKTLTSLLN